MKKINFILSILISIIITNCDNINVDKKMIFKFPKIIDTLNIQNLESTSTDWINRKPEHNPHYFGKICDSVFIARNLRPMLPPPPPPPGTKNSKDYSNFVYKPRNKIFDKYFREWMGNHNFKIADSIKLIIRIDTTQTINKNDRKAYPVLIENKSIDTVYIGYGEHIPIITEAKTKNGIWKPIEKRFSYKCGMGIPSIILPPQELIITSELVYSGNFKTKLRIKLGNNYSSEFYGVIKESQFENEWENGKRKTLPNKSYN